MRDNVRALYERIGELGHGHKGKFIVEYSDYIGVSVHTLQNHWFGRFFKIPESRMVQAVVFMQKYILNENSKR